MPEELTDGQLNRMIALAQSDGVGGDSGDGGSLDAQAGDAVQDATDTTKVVDIVDLELPDISDGDASDIESDADTDADVENETETQPDDGETIEDVPDVDVQDVQIVEIAPDVPDVVDAVDVAEVDADVSVIDVVDAIEVQEVVDTVDAFETEIEVEQDVEIVAEVDAAEIAPDISDAVDAVDIVDANDILDVAFDVADVSDVLDVAGDVSECGAKNCDDGNSCTLDSCDPVSAACKNVAQTGTACNDGNLCTIGDVCKDGACAAGKAKDCDDGDYCTADLCKAESGCVNPKNWVKYEYWPEIPVEWTVTVGLETSCSNKLFSGSFKDVCVMSAPKGLKAGTVLTATLDLQAVRKKYSMGDSLALSTMMWGLQTGNGTTSQMTAQIMDINNSVITSSLNDSGGPKAYVQYINGTITKLVYRFEVLSGVTDNIAMWSTTLVREKQCFPKP